MALTHHAVRRGLAASIHTHWRRESLVAGDEGDGAMPPAPPAGGPPPGFMPICGDRWHLWPRTPPAHVMAAPMAWQAECMRDDDSFGAWLRPLTRGTLVCIHVHVHGVTVLWFACMTIHNQFLPSPNPPSPVR